MELILQAHSVLGRWILRPLLRLARFLPLALVEPRSRLLFPKREEGTIDLGGQKKDSNFFQTHTYVVFSCC